MGGGKLISGVANLWGGKGGVYVKAAGNGFRDMGQTRNCSVAPVSNCCFANAAGVSCENANFDPANTLPYQVVVGAVNADGIKASYSTAGPAISLPAPAADLGLTTPRLS